MGWKPRLRNISHVKGKYSMMSMSLVRCPNQEPLASKGTCCGGVCRWLPSGSRSTRASRNGNDFESDLDTTAKAPEQTYPCHPCIQSFCRRHRHCLQPHKTKGKVYSELTRFKTNKFRKSSYCEVYTKLAVASFDDGWIRVLMCLYGCCPLRPLNHDS